MMTTQHYMNSLFIVCLLALMPGITNAQNDEEMVARIILQKDNLFWDSYNRCDTTNYRQYFSDDVEFYHDKGGITRGVESMAMSVKKNLCSNSDFRVRREVVKGTVKFFPMKNSGVIYGAILSGDHLFYVSEKGKPTRLDGRASFTHLWLLRDNVWKMERILSYDHGPAQR